jgi:hypothetical protein
MKALCVLSLVCLGALPASAIAKSKVAPFGCTSFMDDFIKGADGHKATFERPLNITRGGDDDGIDIRILSTADKIEGTLKCRGDEFRRFEVRAAAPVDEKREADLRVYEKAALLAAFRWDRPKAETVVGAMSSDAAEYLRASVQRGDTYHAGKVEYHQGDLLDLGLIWTETDHTFIISTQTED